VVQIYSERLGQRLNFQKFSSFFGSLHSAKLEKRSLKKLNLNPALQCPFSERRAVFMG